MQVLNDPDTIWTTVTLSWYDGQARDPQGDYALVGLLSTDPAAEPLSIVAWFVQRWQLEVTFEEARRQLGVETQRQWSDKAIARTRVSDR